MECFQRLSTTRSAWPLDAVKIALLKLFAISYDRTPLPPQPLSAPLIHSVKSCTVHGLWTGRCFYIMLCCVGPTLQSPRNKIIHPEKSNDPPGCAQRTRDAGGEGLSEKREKYFCALCKLCIALLMISYLWTVFALELFYFIFNSPSLSLSLSLPCE